MILAARRRGLRTLVVDANPHAPGAALADEFHPVSTIDSDGLIELTRGVALAGVTTVGTDAPIRAAAAVAAEHGLNAVTTRTAQVCTDKVLMAQVLMDAGLRWHRYATASTLAELDEAVRHTGLPCIVKPVDSSGSRGVVRVDDTAELPAALRYALAPSKRPEVIVEELLEGPEISCELLVIDGLPHVIAVTDKDTTGSPHFIETGHTQPSSLDAATLEDVGGLAAEALRAVGAHTGPAHVEMILTERGPAIVELGVRLAGDFLSSHLVPLATGIDLLDLVLRQACGEEVEVPDPVVRGGALRFLQASQGVLLGLRGIERAQAVEGVSTVIVLAEPGKTITGLRSSLDRLGVVVAGGPDRGAAVEACERARDLISIDLSPLPEPAGPAEGRRVLVIGAGRGQVGLIRALRHLGAHVVVASLTESNPPGLADADEVLAVNILDVDGVVEGARRAGVDAVATSCLDTGLEALGAVVDALGLRGISRSTAHLCSDKLDMKERLASQGVPTAVFRKVDALDQVADALEATGLPAMVKATDLQGSSGVFRVSTLEQAQEAFTAAHEQSRHGTVLIETFLEGREFGAQALVHDGELLHVTVHGDIMAPGPVPAPVAHHVPLEPAGSPGPTTAGGGPTIEQQAVATVEAAVRAIGLDNCAVNIDLIESGGTVHVIELTGRAGANGLPEIMTAVHGVDYYEMVAREALDLDVAGAWARRAPWDGAVLGEMLIDQASHGTVTEVRRPQDLEDWVVDLSLFRGVGDTLTGFSSSGDCLGQVVVRGTDLEQCRHRVDLVRERITFVTEEQP